MSASTPAATMPASLPALPLPSRAASLAPARPLGWTARETLVAHLAVTAFALAAVAMWLWAGAVVPWDSKNGFYPAFRFLGQSLASGETPFWNPYHFSGFPQVADPQSLIFAPLMAVFAWAMPKASMQAFDAAVMAHLLIGGFGVLALFRVRGWAPAGAVLAAMTFMLAGSASARLQHTGMILSYGLFPVALALLEQALDRRSTLYAAAFGLVAAIMALGRDQVAYLFCLTLIGVVVWRALDATSPLRWTRERLPVLLMAGAVGAATLAIPSLLTLQLLSQSNRPGIAYGVAVTGSLAPVNLATLFAPNVFGSLNWDYSYWGPGYETSPDPDWTDRGVNFVYLGAVPFVLLGWFGVAGRRLNDRGVRPFAFLGLIALLYALGRATPVFGVLFDHLPGVSLYRRPADATFAFNFAMAMGAGYLLHIYIKLGMPRIDRRKPRHRFVVAVSALVFFVLCLSALWFSQQQGKLMPAATHMAVALATLAAVAYALREGDRRGRRAMVALGLVVFAGVDLLARGAATSLNAEPIGRYSIYATPTPTEEAALAALRADLDRRRDAGETPRVEILGLPGPWMNASMTLRLEDTIGYNPLRLSDYERVIGPGQNAGDVNLRSFPETFRGYRCNMAKLLGLDYLIIDRPLSKLPPQVPRPKSAVALYESDKIHVYRFGPTAPRAVVVGHVRPIDVATAVAEHAIPPFDRAREALIDGDAMAKLSPRLRAAPAPAADSPPAGVAQIVQRKNGRVVVDVDAPKGGLLVLHDIDYPGWEARVDGVPTPILRADVLFRGVELPPGASRVEFAFRPFSLANLAAAAHKALKRGEE